MNLEIRYGEPRDAALITQLIRELARYEKLEHELAATEEKVAKALFGQRPYAETLIAEVDGEPAGFALFFHNFSTFLAQPGIYLEDLFVKPEQRSHGVGRALLERLAQIAVERDCGRLEWAVLNWNEDAIRFYERLGAKPNLEWTVYRLAGESLRTLAGK
ncbi:MAG TPA: GNAT family N-acetyltransferase [Candidatus Dormibacteraeota bacterium]|nr:GNAT family N-acetyltransferase [Candidatus Dormibacteraeota bacterium]